jgi:hypothetical protein
MLKLMTSVTIATALILPSIAYATEDFCAVVSNTPDGFLALREGPGSQFRTIAKLHPGDHLIADTAQCGPLHGRTICQNGGWTRITTMYSADYKIKFESDQSSMTFEPAWVATRYIRNTPCHTP